MTLKVSDADFQEQVLENELPVLVDLWAPWCGPCLMVAPVLEELAEEYKGRLVIAKLNVDENLETARHYRVMSIPTMLFFNGGKEVERIVGALPKKVLKDKLEAALSRPT